MSTSTTDTEACVVRTRRGEMLLGLRSDDVGPVLWFVASALEIRNVSAAERDAEQLAQREKAGAGW